MKKYIKLIPALALVLGLSSCLKDEAVINNDGLRNIIEFQNVGAIKSGTADIYPVYVPVVLDIEAGPTATFEGILSYSGTDVAPEDIVVNFERSDALITQFNAKTAGTKYTPLPASEVTVGATSVTIPKGQRQAKFKVTIKIGLLDKTKSNAIAFKISSASTGVISGNFGSVIFSTPIKSIWEGEYTVNIFNNYGTIDGNLGNKTYTKQRLTTVGPNLVQIALVSQTYSGNTSYQFNADDTSISSIAAFSGSALVTSIQGVDLVDKNTKNFTVRWTWAGRGVTETWTRTGK
jgi:hypothetical protein